jgi:hypothetical protein
METVTKFTPPAGIGDFDQNPRLKDDWNKFLSDTFYQEIKSLSDPPPPYRLNGGDGVPPDQVCFFDPRKQPKGQPITVPVAWSGFPNVLRAKYGEEKAYKIADDLDSLTYFADPNGSRKLLFNFRPQDEYLEWVVRRDSTTGKIKEIVFTCEGPEYWWKVLSNDKKLLLQLYKKYASPEVELSDLLFSENVYSKVDGKYTLKYEKDTYNIFNKWNLSAAIHLTHPNNYLGAEIDIAARATVLRGSGNTPLSHDRALICCAGYGAPNRNSDPKIGAVVNSAARDGNWVTLRDPVGLYISNIDSSQFTKPDGSTIANFKTRCWNVVRASVDGTMILRASVKVPEDEMFDGKPLLLGDLLVGGDQLQYGGQVADTVTLGLYAIIVPGAPKATPIPCIFKCCPDQNSPNIDEVEPIDTDCASRQFRSLTAKLALPKNDSRSIIHQVEKIETS